MGIQNDIKQTRPFRNEHHEALVNLIYTYHWLVNQIKQSLKPYGITLQQYNVLRILRGAGKPLSTSDIRERLLDKMSDTSRMVDRLDQKGLVCRKTCDHDKRLVDISLTDQGREVLNQLDHVNDKMDNILGALSNEEAKVLSELLDKARD
ncbi:MAG: MarR family transcriptional regulator [Bacteroidota bacterium]